MDLHLLKEIADIVLIILTIAIVVAAVYSGLFSFSFSNPNEKKISMFPVVLTQILFWTTLSFSFYLWGIVSEELLTEKVTFIEENRNVQFYIDGDNEIFTVDSLSSDHKTVFANNKFFNTAEVILLK